MQNFECDYCDYSGSSRGLGLHYYHNISHKPKLSERQHDIVTGLLMGDGSIIDKNNTPRLAVSSINSKYLNHLQKEFGGLSGCVFLESTAKENAKRNRNSGFSKNASPENYSDLYKFQTRRSNELKEYSQWYTSGSKIWPIGLNLNYTVFKHWYCGDGNLDENRIRIAMSNEKGNKQKVLRYFKDCNIPSPNRWDENKITYNGDEKISLRAVWTVENSKHILNNIEPPPGFEYKWNY